MPILALAALAPARAAVETYKIDSAHSSVGFNVRHFFTKVPGVFAKSAGKIVVDRDNLEQSSVEATIEVGSVNTREGQRVRGARAPA